jgi:hypothetical protein
MASFHNVRHGEPSAYAEGFGTFRFSSAAAGQLHAAVRTASAHSELATLPGIHAVHSTPKHLTETTQAPQPQPSSVRASALFERGEARG